MFYRIFANNDVIPKIKVNSKLKTYFTKLIRSIFDSSLLVISLIFGLVGHVILILYLASQRHKGTPIVEDLFTFEKNIIISCMLFLSLMDFLNDRVKLPDENSGLFGFVIHQIIANIIHFIFGVLIACTMLFWVT